MEKVGKDFNHNNNEDSVEDCESSDSSGKVNKKKRMSKKQKKKQREKVLEKINPLNHTELKVSNNSVLENSKNDSNNKDSDVVTILKTKQIKRSFEDLNIIAKELEKTKIKSKLQQEKITQDSYQRLLLQLATFVRLEEYKKNQYVFFQNEVGDKFYIILDGEVEVLIDETYSELYTYNEYLHFLIKLKLENDNQLLERIIKLNSSVFTINPNDYSSLEKIVFNLKYKNTLDNWKLRINDNLHNHIESKNELFVKKEKILTLNQEIIDFIRDNQTYFYMFNKKTFLASKKSLSNVKDLQLEIENVYDEENKELGELNNKIKKESNDKMSNDKSYIQTSVSQEANKRISLVVNHIDTEGNYYNSNANNTILRKTLGDNLNNNNNLPRISETNTVYSDFNSSNTNNNNNLLSMNKRRSVFVKSANKLITFNISTDKNNNTEKDDNNTSINQKQLSKRLSKSNVRFKDPKSMSSKHLITKGNKEISRNNENEIIPTSTNNNILITNNSNTNEEPKIRRLSVKISKTRLPSENSVLDIIESSDFLFNANNSDPVELHGKLQDLISLILSLLNQEIEKTTSSFDFNTYSKLSIIPKKERASLIRRKPIACLPKGAYFGDLALDGLVRGRAASIRCHQDSQILAIPQITYKEFIQAEAQRIMRKDTLYLLDRFFFKTIPKPIFEIKFYPYFTKHFYNKGSFIYEENESFDRFFFIVDGEVELSLRRSLLEINSQYKDFLNKLILKTKRLKCISYDNKERLALLAERELSINDYGGKFKLHSKTNPIMQSKEFKHDKKDYRITIIGKDDTLGNEEFFLRNQTRISNCRVISNTVTVFELKIEELVKLLQEEDARFSFYNQCFKRCFNFLKRFETIRNEVVNRKMEKINYDARIKRLNFIEEKSANKKPKIKYNPDNKTTTINAKFSNLDVSNITIKQPNTNYLKVLKGIFKKKKKRMHTNIDDKDLDDDIYYEEIEIEESDEDNEDYMEDSNIVSNRNNNFSSIKGDITKKNLDTIFSDTKEGKNHDRLVSDLSQNNDIELQNQNQTEVSKIKDIKESKVTFNDNNNSNLINNNNSINNNYNSNNNSIVQQSLNESNIKTASNKNTINTNIINKTSKQSFLSMKKKKTTNTKLRDYNAISKELQEQEAEEQLLLKNKELDEKIAENIKQLKLKIKRPPEIEFKLNLDKNIQQTAYQVLEELQLNKKTSTKYSNSNKFKSKKTVIVTRSRKNTNNILLSDGSRNRESGNIGEDNLSVLRTLSNKSNFNHSNRNISGNNTKSNINNGKTNKESSSFVVLKKDSGIIKNGVIDSKYINDSKDANDPIETDQNDNILIIGKTLKIDKYFKTNDEEKEENKHYELDVNINNNRKPSNNKLSSNNKLVSNNKLASNNFLNNKEETKLIDLSKDNKSDSLMPNANNKNNINELNESKKDNGDSKGNKNYDSNNSVITDTKDKGSLSNLKSAVHKKNKRNVEYTYSKSNNDYSPSKIFNNKYTLEDYLLKKLKNKFNEEVKIDYINSSNNNNVYVTRSAVYNSNNNNISNINISSGIDRYENSNNNNNNNNTANTNKKEKGIQNNNINNNKNTNIQSITNKTRLKNLLEKKKLNLDIILNNNITENNLNSINSNSTKAKMKANYCMSSRNNSPYNIHLNNYPNQSNTENNKEERNKLYSDYNKNINASVKSKNKSKNTNKIVRRSSDKLKKSSDYSYTNLLKLENNIINDSNNYENYIKEKNRSITNRSFSNNSNQYDSNGNCNNIFYNKTITSKKNEIKKNRNRSNNEYLTSKESITNKKNALTNKQNNNQNYNYNRIKLDKNKLNKLERLDKYTPNSILVTNKNQEYYNYVNLKNELIKSTIEIKENNEPNSNKANNNYNNNNNNNNKLKLPNIVNLNSISASSNINNNIYNNTTESGVNTKTNKQTIDNHDKIKYLNKKYDFHTVKNSLKPKLKQNLNSNSLFNIEKNDYVNKKLTLYNDFESNINIKKYLFYSIKGLKGEDLKKRKNELESLVTLNNSHNK